MDDIPQGGSGGVPDPGDSDTDDRPDTHEPEQGVKTVRAGTPVAEQKADPEKAGRSKGAARSEGAPHPPEK